MHLAIFIFIQVSGSQLLRGRRGGGELINTGDTNQLKQFLLETFLRMTLKQKSVDKGLLSFLIFLFQVFNVRNDFQVMRLLYCPKTSMKILQDLKLAVKSFLVHPFENVFCH